MPDNFACKEPPDPIWAENGLLRLKEAHPSFPWARIPASGLLRLKVLLGFSPYATNILLRREKILKFFLSEPFPAPSGPHRLWQRFRTEGAVIPEWREFALWLRGIKQEEIIKILVHDLGGRPFSHTVYALSHLADFFLKAGLFWLTEHLFAPALRKHFLVFGFGKLGGRELNYSSDVDLVYFLSGDLSQKEHFINLGRELSRLLDAILEGERLFRVDLRLRPGGKDGELVYSLKAAVHYYFYQAHPFERLALLKARPVAGDKKTGKAFLKALRPVLYPRYLDYAYLEHLRNLKERIAKEAAQKGAERNLKIGPGGIREIEFFCQAFQMIYGGKDPGLRTRNTIWALNKLARKKIIPLEDTIFLKKAYVFLRTLEHRLQTIHFRQTYTLPREEAALFRLARSMGFPDLEVFLKEVEGIRRQVNRIFSGLFARSTSPKGLGLAKEIEAFLAGAKPEKELSEALGLPPHLLKDVKDLTRGSGPLGAKRGPLLAEIFKVLLSELTHFENKEQVLANFISFVERLGGRISFLYALRYNPVKIYDLLEIFARSRFLTHLLQEAPAAAEALFEGEEKGPDLAQRLRGKDTEEALGLLRATKNEKICRLGYLDLKGRLALPDLLKGLSRLAEEIIRHTFGLTSPKEQEGLVILGLGKLGGRELGYRSDLDLIFAASQNSEIVAQTKIAQRFIHYLTVPLPEGPGYQVDTRLRPEGRKGPLVTTAEGLLHYYQKDAALWELLALTKLRPVTGNLALGRQIISEISAYLASLPWGEEEAAELWQMRQRMEKERTTPGLINLKVGAGGLADLEFTVQWLILKNLARNGIKLEGNTLLALKMLKEAAILSPTEEEELRENYLFLRRLDQLLILLLDKKGEEKEYLPEEIKLAQEYFGQDLLERLEAVRTSNRNYLKKFLMVA